MDYVKISTKRGTKGHVTTPDRRMIGRVRPEHKDAAGTYGPNGPAKRKFYTAEVWYDGRRLFCGTLGTRHPTKAHAARAIRMFWDQFEAGTSLGLLVCTGSLDSTVRVGVEQFKYENREVCALDASPMVRVAKPRYAS
jgi:hypothetical protein